MHRRILFSHTEGVWAECECGWQGRWHRSREAARGEHTAHVQEAELDAIDAERQAS